LKQTMDRISGLADKEVPRWFGILLLSDLLDFRYFGRYRSPLFVYFPPFLPPFFQKGVGAPQKGAIAPLLRKKGGTAPFFIPKCTDRVLLRYGIGNTGEIPTEYRPKIPNWYTTLEFSFGIGMVNTEKYRPIPTEKYRLANSHILPK